MWASACLATKLPFCPAAAVLFPSPSATAFASFCCSERYLDARVFLFPHLFLISVAGSSGENFPPFSHPLFARTFPFAGASRPSFYPCCLLPSEKDHALSPFLSRFFRLAVSGWLSSFGGRRPGLAPGTSSPLLPSFLSLSSTASPRRDSMAECAVAGGPFMLLFGDNHSRKAGSPRCPPAALDADAPEKAPPIVSCRPLPILPSSHCFSPQGGPRACL